MSQDRIFVQRCDIGDRSGPEVAIKDCIDIAGLPTWAGSETLAEARPATAHADIVATIIDRGGHIVGKTNMHELAYGVTGINRWHGTPVNPLYPDLITGGSSSGSAAAVAAGLVDIAIGTDTGGSIRMPAACCGVYGLKPTFDRISRKGCTPAESSLDCVGPFARDVAGLERGMALIDPTFARFPVPARIRLGVVDARADPEIRAAVRTALVGGRIDLVPVDGLDLDAPFDAGMTVMAGECWQAFGALTNDERMGDDVRARLLAARNVTAERILSAEAMRELFAEAIDLALEGLDALVLPTLPTSPPALHELGDAARILRLTALVRPFNLSGHPALTIPIDGPDGRPAGIQLVGRRGEDAQLCAVAHVVAAAS